MLMIKLVDARKGLHEKCVELFHNEKVAKSIYNYLCVGIEECDEVELERKKGEWIAEGDGYSDGGIVYDTWYCSKCDHCEEGEFLALPNYCPNCGADMRGEK